MIRSLVVAPNADSSAGSVILHRNLAQENLEMRLAEGCTMWIDIVTPESEEIRWLEGWLQLSPNVVEDLLREDRRPTLLVYPRYLFLSLFQPYVPGSGNGIEGREIHCVIGEHFCVTVRQAVNRLTIISMVFLPFTFFLSFFDSNLFIVDKSVILPINGLVLSVVVTLMMIASIVVMRMVFQRRDWV